MPNTNKSQSNIDDFEDEFVFKPATTSPNIDNSFSKNNISIESVNSPIDNEATISKSENRSDSSIISSSSNLRFPQLDAFIAEKRKEFDLELGKLSKNRLEEFMKMEKAKDEAAVRGEEREGEGEEGPFVKSDEKLKKNYEKVAKEADEKEAKQFEVMREKAKSTWQELRSEFEESLKQMHSEQSIRLAQESQLQDSLRASGTVFNRELFEKIVEKCGKGRKTAYGREKMSRFWEVFDRKFPSESTNSASPAENDQILASLLGKIN